MTLYQRIATSSTPGLIVFLVDQSGSMNSSYHGYYNKATFATTIVNHTINEIINIHACGDYVKDRIFILIVGYGDDRVNEIGSDYLSKYAENPLRIESRKQKVTDGNGILIEIDVQNPVWIEPISSGCSSMDSAFERAEVLVKKWISIKTDSPPPIIVNISAGNVAGKEPKIRNTAKKIMDLSCIDGHPLIFNCHIGDGKEKQWFCESENELFDERAKFLFSISSVIPAPYYDWRHGTVYQLDKRIKSEARYFVSNVDNLLLDTLFNADDLE